jgi:predicted RNA binding protein YcfA (HicA-like mRNA interferase family)
MLRLLTTHLEYRIERQSGSHRRLVADGRPPIICRRPEAIANQTLNWSPTTVVRQAILVLQTQGWVQGVHGLGVFVAGR